MTNWHTVDMCPSSMFDEFQGFQLGIGGAQATIPSVDLFASFSYFNGTLLECGNNEIPVGFPSASGCGTCPSSYSC